MSYTVIDSKAESHSYGIWLVKETVTTKLTLVNMGDGQVGVNYESNFNGVKSGDVQGGPIATDGDKTAVVNDSPKVAIIVSQFNKRNNYASMHIAITVNIPIIGEQNIYRQTLGGHYDEVTGWEAAIRNINIKEQKTGA